MPYIKVDTNVVVPNDKAGALLRELSAVAAKTAGKPESAMQVALDGGRAMLMGGSGEATAHVEMKGIGLAEDQAPQLSEAICRVLADALGVKGPRVFICFSSFKGSMWGKDGKTFG